MDTITKNILILIAIVFTTGCNVSIPEIKYKTELKSTNFEEIVSTLLKKASNQIFPNMSRDEVLLVSNFVDTFTLRSSSKLSFILTDLLKSNLVSRYSYTIKEIELSKNFRFGKEGLKALTRNQKNINDAPNQSRYIVVSSYVISKNQLILFLKLINIENGNVLASSTHSTELTQEIKELNGDLPSETKAISQSVYQPMVL